MRVSKCGWRLLAVMSAILAALVVSAPAFAAHRATTGTIRPVATVVARDLPAARAPAITPFLSPAQARVRLMDPREQQAEAAPPEVVGAPSPSPLKVVSTPDRLGFEGLRNLDQAFAPGNGGFSVEPPDQGLCVGTFHRKTFVFESVNQALQVYDENGNQQLPGAVSLNAFFGLQPSVLPDGTFGPFVSDPKCYFDPETHRWFHTILVISIDNKSGSLVAPAFTALAVSRTNDPLGAYRIYHIPATDRSHPHCPCFGDQPLIGADANGFYVSTAEYSINENFGNFAQIYAMSKSRLEAGKSLRFVHFDNITNRGIGGHTTATVQPAFSTARGQFSSASGGTEYFMSGFDCVPVTCAINDEPFNKVSVWALTRTATLDSASPNVRLKRVNLTVSPFTAPPFQRQKRGPTPFGCNPNLGANCHTPPVEANDARMNQVVFQGGLLYSGINTAVEPNDRVGVEFFVVRPSVSAGKLSASVARQGYVSAAGQHVSFPSIGVNRSGKGVLAFSLMGRDWFPSAAYVHMTARGTSGPIHVAAAGFRPEDGFTCYKKPFGFGPPCRWGDYSASVAGPDGRIWSATEFIGPGARDTFANWSTFVFPVAP